MSAILMISGNILIAIDYPVVSIDRVALFTQGKTIQRYFFYTIFYHRNFHA